MRGKQHDDAPPGDGRGWIVFLILAASAYSPLRTWANASESPSLLTVAFAFAVIAVIGLIIWVGLQQLRLDPIGAGYATTALVLLLTNAGLLIGRYANGHLILMIGSVVAAVLAYRLRRLTLIRHLMAWAAIAAIALPLATFVQWPGTRTETHVNASSDLAVTGLTSTQDVLLIVVDAYTDAKVLQDLYEHDNSPFLDQLETLGFQVDQPVLANYPRTTLSVASVLQLDYLGGETALTTDDVDAIWGILGGQNNLVNAFKAHGYRHVFVESGWLGTRCGPDVNICVTARWPDETFHDVANRSILGGLPGYELGRPFTEGALRSLDWLENDLDQYLQDEVPDLIYVHVLAPHPPLFLDAGCEPDWRGGVAGYAIGSPQMDVHELAQVRARYIDQLECVNGTLLQVARALPEDDVAIMFGDHGPDSLGQLFQSGHAWNEEQRRERFSVFFAARVPGCDMESIGSLVNLGRRLLSCMSASEMPDLETRILDMNRDFEPRRITELEAPGS
jgi:hypothetical protein